MLTALVLRLPAALLGAARSMKQHFAIVGQFTALHQHQINANSEGGNGSGPAGSTAPASIMTT